MNISRIRLSRTTYDIVDASAIHSLAGYSTTAEMNAAITAATDALAESIAEQGYQNADQVATAVQNGITGKADTSAVTEVNNALTAHTANTDIHVTVADKAAWNAKLDASDITGLFGVADYDSTTHRINFYNTSTGGTVLSYIDCTDFIKDGFLQSVTIENKTIEGESVPCLVFVWNTDAGVQETDIPLSGIFDASNYYDKDDVDALLANKANTATTYSKTDVDTLLADKVGNSTYTAYTASTATALAGKQATLVSGTNIKTINNESLLGSGNISIEAAGIVDTVMSNTSENAVQNKVIKAYADTKNPMVSIDGETLVVS